MTEPGSYNILTQARPREARAATLHGRVNLMTQIVAALEARQPASEEAAQWFVAAYHAWLRSGRPLCTELGLRGRRGSHLNGQALLRIEMGLDDDE